MSCTMHTSKVKYNGIKTSSNDKDPSAFYSFSEPRWSRAILGDPTLVFRRSCRTPLRSLLHFGIGSYCDVAMSVRERGAANT